MDVMDYHLWWMLILGFQMVALICILGTFIVLDFFMLCLFKEDHMAALGTFIFTLVAGILDSIIFILFVDDQLTVMGSFIIKLVTNIEDSFMFCPLWQIKEPFLVAT